MPKKNCDFLKKVEGLYFDAGFRRFDIVVKENVVEGGTECWGSTDFDQGTIYLRSPASRETARETLIHEITHVILAIIGLGGYDKEEMGGEHADGYIGPTNNEHLALCLSRGFMAAFNLNRDLFEIILEREGDS